MRASIVGVAQAANKDIPGTNSDEDRILHPADLIAEVARQALDDAGIRPEQVGAIFATPLSTFTDDDASLLTAARLGIPDGLRAVTGYSGASPHQMIARAIAEIESGTCDVVLLVGGIADASVRRARQRGMEPPSPQTSHWSQGSKGAAEALHEALAGYPVYCPEIAAGAGLPSAYFALMESSLGLAMAPDEDPVAHRERLGRLLAPFTDIAATHPGLAWFPQHRSAAEISTPTPSNRLIAEPFTKLMCSFPTVDLAAAVVVARDGIGRGPGVRPLAVVTGEEVAPPSGRPVVHTSPVLEALARAAQELSGVDLADVAGFDLYSCFPTAVLLLSGALGIGQDDPRPRTATGGLPYFGGPGASYSLHGVTSLVEQLRADPDRVLCAASLGGMVNDFGLGVYAFSDRPAVAHDFGTAGSVSLPMVRTADGPGTIVASTVLHDREDGPVAVPAIVELPDGSRTGARSADPQLPADAAGRPPLVGRAVVLTTDDAGGVSYQLS